ncbi:MAG: acylphosphatase [Lachnoclostridium edouardi]|uniref:acylphosphatase n=1 Tax=Lachnoclostridium edouardi TaxID=1926283 RepID=UPI0026DBA20F|nr:acylphosphatase [Lachnoclostridium edouardi]MDO4278739.1 acylphosphatase [Lachnoclostridium edouardi]
MKEDRNIRKHIYFSGMVQGVGFRYRSRYIAQSLGLTGWVSNLWDGRVEMEVQGKAEAIEKMIEQLFQARFIQIDNIEAKEIPVQPEGSFSIK